MAHYRWRVCCMTDERWEYVEQEAAPTECPVDSGHTIDLDSIAALDVVMPDVVVRSPNGTDYRLTVDNDGNLGTEEVP